MTEIFSRSMLVDELRGMPGQAAAFIGVKAVSENESKRDQII
jgi:hypothetical protein